MLCTEVLGKVSDEKFAGLEIDYVDFDWHEAFKKLHRKTSAGGRDVGVRLDDWVLARGLSAGDVLGVEDGVAVAVRLLPTHCLVIDVAPDHPFMLARVGWEVGNTHTPLFYGEGSYQLLCEYSEPLERLLTGLHAVTVTTADAVLDPAERVSGSAHHHPHGEEGHGHHHEHEDGHEHPHEHGHEGHCCGHCHEA